MTDSVRPLVSCIMAVNRDDGYLDRAIQSILDQSLREFEFIIVANNCSDELWQKLSQITDSRIRLFRTKIGQLPFNLNYALNEARADFVARMDADDIAVEGRFKIQYEYMLSHPEVSVLGSAIQVIDGSDKTLYIECMPQGHSEIVANMPWNCTIVHPTVMFRREAIIRARGYAYTFFAEDYELWLRLMRKNEVRFANLSQSLLLYRVHENQSTSKERFSQNFAEVAGLMIREFILTGRMIFILSLMKRYVGSNPIIKRILGFPYLLLKKIIK